MVTKTKANGGLRVINLKVQNEALLMKNLHKFYNKKDLPWVKLIWSNYYNNEKLPGQAKNGSFWWRSILILLDSFKGLAQVEEGLGDTILFLSDMWNGQVLQQAYPNFTHLP
jgi:hypothetical protein